MRSEEVYIYLNNLFGAAVFQKRSIVNFLTGSGALVGYFNQHHRCYFVFSCIIDQQHRESSGCIRSKAMLGRYGIFAIHDLEVLVADQQVIEIAEGQRHVPL